MYKQKLRAILCLLLTIKQITKVHCISVQAREYDCVQMVEGVVPPSEQTIVFDIEDTTKNPYTKIANGLSRLWVGEEHRFTLAVNQRESVSVKWSSTDEAVAVITPDTGELTAVAPGRVRIVATDFANHVIDSCMLEVLAVPDIPEIPAEWYEVSAQLGTSLELKEECLLELAERSLVRFPDVINGEAVHGIKGGPWWKYEVEVLQFPSEMQMTGYENWVVDELMFYENTQVINWVDFEHLRCLHLPEGVITLADCFSSDDLQETRIPASVKYIGHSLLSERKQGLACGKQVSFCVDGNNTNYYSLFGVLFSYPFYEEGKQEHYSLDTASLVEVACGCNMLLAYPASNSTEVYIVPDGVEKIGAKAFHDTVALKKVILPETVTALGVGAFWNCAGLEEIVIPASVTEFEGDEHTGLSVMEGEEMLQSITIITPAGSAAEAYAIEYGIKYRNE
ncbi:MAG: leucine-rich repeat protein [Lachnospiraceae bacterium]|nr:leucine-rich repeat protein [Lachnospiraceae bacterium]